jgi:hypothetical protein
MLKLVKDPLGFDLGIQFSYHIKINRPRNEQLLLVFLLAKFIACLVVDHRLRNKNFLIKESKQYLART